MRRKGLVFVLSGPSGSGKTTLYQSLLKDKKLKLLRSISCTTRKPRAGEKNGSDYFFLSKNDFLKKQKRGFFLETQKVFDALYGTPKDYVEKITGSGKDILLCIDVKGAMVIKKKLPQAVMIFVETLSFSELSRRLEQRSTESPKSKLLRLKTAKCEMAFKKHYHHSVVNDKLPQAIKELKNLIRQSRIAHN